MTMEHRHASECVQIARTMAGALVVALFALAVPLSSCGGSSDDEFRYVEVPTEPGWPVATCAGMVHAPLRPGLETPSLTERAVQDPSRGVAVATLLSVEPVLDRFSAAQYGFVEPLEGAESRCRHLDGTLPSLRLQFELVASSWSDGNEQITVHVGDWLFRRSQPRPVLTQSGPHVNLIWADDPRVEAAVQRRDLSEHAVPRFAPEPGVELFINVLLGPHGLTLSDRPHRIDKDGHLIDDQPSEDLVPFFGRNCSAVPDLEGMDVFQWLDVVRDQRGDLPLTERNTGSLPATYCRSLTVPEFEDEDEPSETMYTTDLDPDDP